MKTLLAAFMLVASGASLKAIVPIYTAYQVPAGTVGNQNLSGASQTLGMDFTVNSAIQITALGVFDSGGDGLIAPLDVRIYNLVNQAVVADISFTPANPGTLIGGSRFLNFSSPLLLPAGFQGTICVAYTTNPTEPNGNMFSTGAGNWTTDSGGGLISFTGLARHSDPGTGNTFPNVIDAGPANRYAAGTFMFSAVPEPATGTLLVFAGIAAFMVRKLGR